MSNHPRDGEMTRLCAEAMGIKPNQDLVKSHSLGYALAHSGYDPLTNDEQAMALLRWIVRYNDNERLEISNHVVFYQKREFSYTQFGDFSGNDKHLNRAIVECVAKLQEAKP